MPPSSRQNETSPAHSIHGWHQPILVEWSLRCFGLGLAQPKPRRHGPALMAWSRLHLLHLISIHTIPYLTKPNQTKVGLLASIIFNRSFLHLLHSCICGLQHVTSGSRSNLRFNSLPRIVHSLSFNSSLALYYVATPYLNLGLVLCCASCCDTHMSSRSTF